MPSRGLITALCLAASALMAAVQAEEQGQRTGVQSELAKELEGLAPGPRIEYLRFLSVSRPADPEVFFQLGVAFHEDGKGDSALVYYRKATQLDPGLSKAYVNMGVLLDDMAKPGEAIAMFEKAVSINPNDFLAHAHAGYMLFEEGSHEEGYSHLAKALAIDSLDAQPHFYLAIFFWESGMYREALTEWETVVRLAPGSYLAAKAEENITILQQALTGSVDRPSVRIQR